MVTYESLEKDWIPDWVTISARVVATNNSSSTMLSST